jgi:signal transduction histidine kinase
MSALFSRLGIGAKFSLMTTLTLLVILSFVTFLNARTQYATLMGSLETKGEALGQFVALISPPSILAYDFEGMEDLVREVNRDDDIVYAVLISNNGINLTNYLATNKPLVARVAAGKDTSSLLEAIELLNREPALLAMRFDVLFENERIGEFRLGIDRSRIQEVFYSGLFRYTASNLIVVLVLSGVIFVGFRWIVMHRIEYLSDGLGRIARGDLDTSLKVDAHDEIGKLLLAFNDMSGQLRESIGEKDHFASQLQSQASELRRLSDEAIKANRHKSEFLANMSHELRTPLNAIIGFSEVLKEQMFGQLNDKQSEYAEDIHSSGKHLLSLINDILDLSKIEAGKIELNITRFSLPLSIENALVLIKERAARHTIEIEYHIDNHLDTIVADERRFRQILINLLGNAIKFTPDGGKVSLVAQKSGDHVMISIADTGKGIPRESLDSIFEAFHQVTDSSTESREGTGLGLSVTKSFVEMHDGRISVESEPGCGSKFTFTLPLARPFDD